MTFNETKVILNDLLWQFNGNKGNNGLCRITEAIGHSFDVVVNDNKKINIDPKKFSSKGELAKFILDICY